MPDPEPPPKPFRFLDETVGNTMSVHVVRDPEFRRYCPSLFSIWATPDATLVRFDLSLQRMETVERKFYIPTGPQGAFTKDVQTEVYELALIQMNLHQLIQLRSQIDSALKGQTDEVFIRHGLSPDAKVLK